MHKSIQDMLNDMVEREGGFVNHPNDRGGATKYGVTIGTLSKYLGKPATISDVKALDVETAKDIFSRSYFLAPGLDGLPSNIQPVAFDMSVLHGPRAAVRMIQEVLTLAGFPCDADGRIGPKTRMLAKTAGILMGDFLVNAIVERRVEFLNAIVEARPSQSVFINGWTRRANSFRMG